MTGTENRQAVADRVLSAMSEDQVPGWDIVIRKSNKESDREAPWVYDAISTVLDAIGDEDVSFIFLGGSGSVGDQEVQLEAVVVAPSILVQLKADARPNPSDVGKFSVSALSLHHLVKFDVKKGMSPDEGVTSPGYPEVTLHFGDGTSLELPLAAPQSEQQRQPLREFVLTLPRLLKQAE